MLAYSQVIGLNPARTEMSLDRDRDGGETLTVTLSEIDLDALTIEGESWAVVRVPTAALMMERGLPALPYLTSNYLLNDDNRIRLELISATPRVISLGDYGFRGVAPSKGHFNRDIDPETVSYVFEERVYDSDLSFPGQQVNLSTPFIAGPVRAQAFQLNLVSWQAQSNLLTVLEQVEFRIVKMKDHENPRVREARPMSSAFMGLRDRAVNRDLSRDPYSPFVELGRLLILCHDSFLTEIQPLVDWETLVGYPTLLTPLSTVGATPSANDIQSYIQSLYDAPEGLAYIILVGDAAQIPYLVGLNEGAACDPCYTKLEGNDNYPDAAISRISAQTPAEVTVQVNKILDYEQLPDQGANAFWYSAAFGVAGNDTGGSPSYADWERMDFLKNDLLSPAYTFDQFTEIYHNPPASDVTAAVDDGRSLGLYIGHGSETGWVTSGFDTGDVANLANENRLPVIWDVACVNGKFQRSGGDCFAESWLKKSGGGAVSFEAATTNESWVPPCDAQRGFVDAIRYEWAFTTGGQHLNGKYHCFNLNGDTNGSEGNKFMEQSTLFGSCVTWPRTVSPLTPDEPTDFNMMGSLATLTVTVSGTPYGLDNGAIVSFFTQTSRDITAVGSGLIDENGVVEAAVTAPPTHCHIHGFNLIPSQFELAARPEGRVMFDANAYRCDAMVNLRVVDSNVTGASPTVIDTVDITLAAAGQNLPVTLTETGVDKGFYEGTATLGTDLVVGNGDVLTATYVDEDDGAGGTMISREATADVDCQGPGISQVTLTATESSLTVSFQTDEPGDTVVYYGPTTPPAQMVNSTALVDGEHTITIDGLDPCAQLYLEISSTDAYGNTTRDDQGGAYYAVQTAGWGTLFEETLDADPGWTIDNGGNANGWAFGQPTGQDGDPDSGHTGDFVYGVNLDGDYDGSLTDNQLKLTTPAVDCSEATSVFLRYWRLLGVEQPIYDHARIRVSTDGGSTWTVVWENTATIQDSDWTFHEADLTTLAAGQPDVRIQWTMGSSDGYLEYQGWNIDDISLEGAIPCEVSERIFDDGFESGNCTHWSNMVSN